ncbi:hypothetical protein ACHAQA_004227 [Verticillium albo-atrum]
MSLNAMAAFSEGFVMADPTPLPETATRIISDTRKHAPGFAEILFEPETSCFKIITYKKNMDTVMSMVLKFIKDNKRDPEAFVKENVEINIVEYDHLRYPASFAAMPFRAINRDLAEMDHQINLAKIMINRGWSLDEGSDQFRFQTGCTISSNLEGTTIYLGAEKDEDLKFATEMLQIIIKDTVKEEREKREAEAGFPRPRVDTAKSVPIKAAAGFYPAPEKGSLIDISYDEAQSTPANDWVEPVQPDVTKPATPVQDKSAGSSASEDLDTISQLADKADNLSLNREKKKQKKKKKTEPRKSHEEQFKGALNNLLSGNDVPRVHWSSVGVSYNHVKQVVEGNRGAAVAADQGLQLMDICTENQKAFNCNYDGLEKLGQENKRVAKNSTTVVAPGMLIDLGDGNIDFELRGHAITTAGPAPDNLLD